MVNLTIIGLALVNLAMINNLTSSIKSLLLGPLLVLP